jgi:hypothetical protein
MWIKRPINTLTNWAVGTLAQAQMIWARPREHCRWWRGERAQLGRNFGARSRLGATSSNAACGQRQRKRKSLNT